MAKRARIGLIYSYDETWIAGSYYILNLIHALKCLPEEDRPEIRIYSSSTSDLSHIQSETQYPYLSFMKIVKYRGSFTAKVWRNILLKRLRFPFFDNRPRSKDADIFFPNPIGFFFDRITRKKRVYWIPDFQEVHLPHFFSEKEITARTQHQKDLVQKKANIVFSSRDALRDFNALFPENACRTFILNFAVTHPDYHAEPIAAVRQNYAIPEKYFFCANQFWQHKNHILILQALKILNAQKTPCVVVFSGNTHDYRSPDHFATLKKFVSENQITENVRFTGFLDRKVQLRIMSESLAVIQPSLFEGWSTVVEDAKAMNQHLLLSDLAVHREQNPSNTTYFDPRNANDLAAKMRSKWLAPDSRSYSDYYANKKQFAEVFSGIIRELSS